MQRLRRCTELAGQPISCLQVGAALSWALLPAHCCLTLPARSLHDGLLLAACCQA
jgi:hypothetical protein